MKPKYELRWQSGGDVFARKLSSALTRRKIDPAWKKFAGSVAIALALVWGLSLSFFTVVDAIGLTSCVLIVSGVIGGMMWADMKDNSLYSPRREKRPGDKLFYSYDIPFRGEMKAMGSVSVERTIEAALKSEEHSVLAEEIIEAGISAMEGLSERKHRTEVSAALTPHIRKLEKQLAEEEFMKARTAREHVEMLLGKEPV